MSKYRFKTKEEFIRDDLWDDEHNVPLGWATSGDMNNFLGTDIPECINEHCDSKGAFIFKGWNFSSEDYVLKEESKNWATWVPKKEINANGFEYFGDKVMEVSDTGTLWTPRVVFGKKEGYYLTWANAETLEESKNAYDPVAWKYARPIKTKLTLKQVADKFGLKEDEIEIL